MIVQEKAIEQLERISSHLASIGEKENYTDVAIQALEQTIWIPVSERLPRQNEFIGNVCKYYLVQNEFGDMLVATYTNRGWIPINTMQALEYEVVAWKPLPIPYKKEEEE